MNLSQIKSVINSDMADALKETMIISIIANDEHVIPSIMKILSAERKQNKELIYDSNSELSRALVVLENGTMGGATPQWTADQIKKHYQKHKDIIRCDFNVKGIS